jgi:ribosome-associated protein
MVEINQHLRIPDDEFAWSYARSSGPGGQNVNKVASKAVLRWHVANTPSLPGHVKARLMTQQVNRLTSDGVLILTSQQHRDQERNRQDCLDKLRAMVKQAAAIPKKRRPTRPTRGSKERRLQAKKRRAMLKTARRKFDDE